MLNVFTLANGRLFQEEIESAEELAQSLAHVQPVWVDLEAPSDEEKGWIKSRFDLVIPDFYDPDDRQKGYIDSVDRKGNHERYAIMSLSIAVVTNEHREISHPGDVSKIASELKKVAKAMKGSVYVKDQRGTGVGTPQGESASKL